MALPVFVEIRGEMMNEGHLQFLSSPEWARMLETDLLPWLLDVADLGDDVLEVGPGPGLTTDLLRRRVSKLTAVELDEALATALAARLSGTNVEVVRGDAADSGLATGRFSAATCSGMLHHIPSSEQQDKLFAELYRILRPSGALLGTDSVDAGPIRQFHADDVFVPIQPEAFGPRLEAVGFTNVRVEVGDFEVRFNATKRANAPAG